MRSEFCRVRWQATTFGCLQTARGYQQNRAMAERNQFADTAAGVCAFEGSVLGAASVGQGIPGREHGEPDRRDGAGLY